MRPEKRAPLGICDQCGGPIAPGDWYTSKGRPRLHCSLQCKLTANSRAGAPIRARKAKARVASGTWINPRSGMTPEQVTAVQSRASRAARLHEVAEGRWRNPALSPEARAKLSRPRKHSGPLASAMEKLRAGRGATATLTEEEHAAWLAYRAEQRDRRRDAIRAYYRARWARRWRAMSEAERERLRARWREQNRRRAAS